MAGKRAGVDPPSADELEALLGARAFSAWKKLAGHVDANHPKHARLWSVGDKAGVFELKYRRGGKTLCALYARERHFGFMLVFGKAERERFEASRGEFPAGVAAVYDGAKTYHDGKWMMFEVRDAGALDPLARMLAIKAGKR